MSRARAAWVVWLVSVSATAAGIALMTIPLQENIPPGNRLSETLPYAAIPLSTATIGALIASRRPQNAVGWLFSGLGGGSSLQFLVAGYAIVGAFGPSALIGADVAAWAFAWSGICIPLFCSAAVFVFPDGRLTLRRARIGLALTVAAAALTAAGAAFAPGPLFNMPEVTNRFGWRGQEALVLSFAFIGIVVWVAGLVLMASTVYERYRRAGPAEQLQLKWFVAGVAFTMTLVLAGAALAVEHWALAKLTFTVGVTGVPVSIAIAILRHRLFDIDVLINRALVYGATTAGIAVAFFGGIIALQSILRPFTSGSELSVAASTLLSFALFQPLRRRVQHAVDRRFYRSRYDAARTLDEFSVRLRDQVALDAVRADLLDAVRETVQPVHAGVWLRAKSR